MCVCVIVVIVVAVAAAAIVVVTQGLQLQWSAREEQKLVERTLYDELISSILKLVDKLDLSSTRAAGLDGEVRAC